MSGSSRGGTESVGAAKWGASQDKERVVDGRARGAASSMQCSSR